MEKLKKNKEKIFMIVAVIVLFIAVVGVSYAAFSYTRTGEKLNAITTGAIRMSYEESSNVISIDKALPTTDATGKVRLKEGEYFDFTLSTTIQGTTNVNWEIAAQDVTTGSKKIDGKYIKLYLTEVDSAGTETEVMAPTAYSADTSANGYTGRPANMMSLAIGSTSTTFNKKYRLRMYVDESYNPQGDGGNLVFSVKVNAYGKTGEAMSNGTKVATQLLKGVGKNGAINTSDSEQTFITGTNPNNYIWYSGKLWRAVSVDPSDNSVKLVTQWNISSIPYNASGNTAFEGSYMQQWLNDTTRDGFLGNLREPEKFIKTDSVWNATLTTATTKPAKTTMVTSAVGLLNMYEYTMSYKGTTYSNGYLNNGLYWWTLTPYNTSKVRYVSNNGVANYNDVTNSYGGRPAINLKSSVEIVSGSGTASDPYRLKGDNDTPTSGTKLATRYSGEYIRFGTRDNNLYQIVSHETEEMTKIVSAIPLKENGSYKTISFNDGSSSTAIKDFSNNMYRKMSNHENYVVVESIIDDDPIYSNSNTIGSFLNRAYLTNSSYLTTDQVNMIEDNVTWYLGAVGTETSYNYKLAKYVSEASTNLTSNTATAKVGLLRYGELNSGQFDRYENNTSYWTLTPFVSLGLHDINNYGSSINVKPTKSDKEGIRPTFNLASNVVITSGDGTKDNPFEVALQ